MEKEKKITVPIDICVEAAERQWIDKSVSMKKFKKSQYMLKFHITKDISFVNTLISEEGAMFEPPDMDTADDLRFELTFMKKGSKNYQIKMEKIKKLSTRQVIFSSTMVLAFVYRIIKTYPEMIPLIDNAMFVERAIKYMEGSYIDKIAKLMKEPTHTIQVCDFNPTSTYSTVHRWVENVLEMMCNMLAQYGATGDEKYIDAMDEWPLFQHIPLHRELVDIGPEYSAAEIVNWYCDVHKKFTDQTYKKYGIERYTAPGNTTYLIHWWLHKNFPEYVNRRLF